MKADSSANIIRNAYFLFAENHFFLVFIYNLHITGLKNRKQLHYIVCKMQVCYLDRNQTTVHIQLNICVMMPQCCTVLCILPLSGQEQYRAHILSLLIIPFLHSEGRRGCLCRKAVPVHFPADVLAPSARTDHVSPGRGTCKQGSN